MQYPDPTTEEPTPETIARWADENRARATDGCWVTANDPVCEHGHPSWLIALGLEEDPRGD